MWKIFLFIEGRILYPIYFTICFAIYYLLYVIFMFKLPKINFVKEFKNEEIACLGMISTTAHILSVMVTGLAIMLYIISKYLYK
jgi:hypothetical protein